MTNPCLISRSAVLAKLSNQWAKIRLVLGLTLLVLLGATVSGCGFQPLYGQTNSVGALRKIGLDVPNDRTGFLVRQAFYDQVGGTPGETPRFKLKLKINERHYGVGYSSTDNANRYEINEAISWSLVERDTDKVLKTGSRTLVISYAASGPAYAGVSAHQDGQARGAEQIAQSLIMDLGLYFSKPTE